MLKNTPLKLSGAFVQASLYNCSWASSQTGWINAELNSSLLTRFIGCGFYFYCCVSSTLFFRLPLCNAIGSLKTLIHRAQQFADAGFGVFLQSCIQRDGVVREQVDNG